MKKLKDIQLSNLLVVFFLGILGCKSQNGFVEKLEIINSRNSFNGSILISQNDSILFNKSYGLANKE